MQLFNHHLHPFVGLDIKPRLFLFLIYRTVAERTVDTFVLIVVFIDLGIECDGIGSQCIHVESLCNPHL